MFKVTRTILTLSFCILLGSCTKPIVYVKTELKAWDHMADAAKLEKSQDYAKAAQAYAFVAEQYPSTTYYPTAVRKAAILNIHPSNSKMDISEALKWFEVYLGLPISVSEKEIIHSNLALLEKLKNLQIDYVKTNSEKEKISLEKDSLLSLVRNKSGEIETGKLRIQTLETELSKTQAQLKEMKKVDLQMHTRKVNGNASEPVEPVQQALTVYPEAYSPAVSEAHAQGVESKDVPMAQKKVMSKRQKKAKVKPPSSGDCKSSETGLYPYTIQIYSFFQKEDSLRAARESRREGESTFTCPAYVPGKGHWYRVFLGCHKTLKEAKETARELKKQKHPHAFVSKMPYAIQIENASSEEDLDKIKAELQSRGYLAYGVPDKKSDNKTAVLVGAFRTEEEATQQAWYLRKKDLKPIVVRR